MSFNRQQFKPIDTTGHTFKDPRLAEIEWKEIQNKWGRPSWVIKQDVAEANHKWLLQYFLDIGDSENRIFEESGLYYYKWKGNDIFKNVRQTGKSSWTQERKDQRKEDLAGLEGSSSSNQSSYNDRQEAIQKAHEENMLASAALTEAFWAVAKAQNRNAEAIENQNRLKQIELGQSTN